MCDNSKMDFLVGKGEYGKWNKPNHKRYICFIDGNKMNCDKSNLKYVSLKEAIRHINDWVVEWDYSLNPEERAFVTSYFQKKSIIKTNNILK